ncbi:Alpha-(1,3)-fucosyltransferase 9 [Podila clonocystis]|nr:Alpha-(1,3)-fucosyltransferase 9 [Podila clonocystis]
MKALMEKIGAHSYGKCQNNKEMPERFEGESWDMNKDRVLQGYQFTRGYVTEKIYDSFQSGNIPVFWRRSYRRFVPKDSYIAFKDFNDIDELVHFLTTVDRLEYYHWKQEVKADYKTFCKSCHIPEQSIECQVLEQAHYD